LKREGVSKEINATSDACPGAQNMEKDPAWEWEAGVAPWILRIICGFSFHTSPFLFKISFYL
jgi:hypothetical protein